MAKEIKIIGLDELELTNDDIFVRKPVNDYSKDDVVIVAETHCAMLLKDGKLQDTLAPGRYPLFELEKKFFGLVREKNGYRRCVAVCVQDCGTSRSLGNSYAVHVQGSGHGYRGKSRSERRIRRKSQKSRHAL